MPLALTTKDKARLDEFYEEACGLRETFIGYPCTGRFDYSDLIRLVCAHIIYTHEFLKEKCSIGLLSLCMRLKKVGGVM